MHVKLHDIVVIHDVVIISAYITLIASYVMCLGCVFISLHTCLRNHMHLIICMVQSTYVYVWYDILV